MNPLALTSFTATSCIGRGVSATLATLRERRTGLVPCAFETVALDTWVGEVAGVDDAPLPATLREFEQLDLGADIASEGTAVAVRPQRPTSILLSDELKEALRRRGRELGVGYQTAAKMILAKYVNAKL